MGETHSFGLTVGVLRRYLSAFHDDTEVRLTEGLHQKDASLFKWFNAGYPQFANNTSISNAAVEIPIRDEINY